jgi:hypothetical protein
VPVILHGTFFFHFYFYFYFHFIYALKAATGASEQPAAEFDNQLGIHDQLGFSPFDGGGWLIFFLLFSIGIRRCCDIC